MIDPVSAALSHDILTLWKQIEELEYLQKLEYARLGHSSALLAIPVSGPDRLVHVKDIALIEADGRRCRVHLRAGEPILSNTAFTLARAVEALASWPQFQRLHESALVNLHQVESVGSHPLQVRDYQLRLIGGQTVTVPETRAPMLMRWFELESLRKVKPFHRRWGAAFYLENLRPFPKQLRLMNADELRSHFAHPRTGKVQTRELIANFIWEYYQFMSRGMRPPIQGNIRTFWYLLKPTLAKLVTIQGQKQYAIMLDVFQRMAVRHKLFKFRDFDFTDEGQQFYELGDRHPNIILVSEKTGHYKRLQALHKELGFTLIALGGMPSILTTEYFSVSLAKALRATKARSGVHILSITDYNPSGAIILKAFTNQLAHEGIRHLASVQNLLLPSHFSPDELQAVTEPLPLKTKADKTKAERWLAAGGGVDGQPLGIESEALILNAPHFHQVLQDAFQQAVSGGATTQKLRRKSYSPLEMTTTENLLQLRETQELTEQ